MNPHLTDEEFFHLLDSSRRDRRPDQQSLEVEQHLFACARCHAEFTNLRDSLKGFRLAATNLSLAHTPARSQLTHRASAPARFFTIPRAAWATGLVAAMALCTASVSILHRPAGNAHPPAAIAAAPSAITNQPQSDDALLKGIDSDLSTSLPPSLSPLDPSTASEAAPISNSN